MPTIKESVLVVDDDIRILRMIHRIMELEGYRVLTAEDAEGALKVFDEEVPSLVLLDIMMPGMDGLEMFRRAKEINPEIAAIILTGYGTPEREIEAMRLGVKKFVRKPITIDQLANVINDTLAKARIEKNE